MTRQGAIGETPVVGVLDGVDDPTRNREPKWTTAGSKDHNDSGSRSRIATVDREPSASVHVPAEQPVNRAVEGAPPGSHDDVTVYVAVAGRQGGIARSAQLSVRQIGDGQICKQPPVIPPHQITVPKTRYEHRPPVEGGHDP
jgi:hypothetical protein